MPHHTLRSRLQLTLATMAILFLAQGCAKHTHPPSQGVAPDPIVTKTIQQPKTFNGIETDGSVTLNLQQSPSYKQPHITVTGKQSLLNDMQFSVHHHHLVIHASHDGANAQHTKLTVQVPQLTELKLSGHSKITASFRDQLSPLSVQLHGHSALTLNGMVQLHQLEQKDNSLSHIVFTNSATLHITLFGHSQAFIAGRAQHLMARAFNHSELLALHLRADQSWLQANHHAIIRISPLHHSHAFTNDHALIMYGTTPQHSTAYHTEHSAELRAIPPIH